MENRRKPYSGAMPSGVSPPLVDSAYAEESQKVKLSKDRIDQNLLQNMNKEMIFEGLKKMYRKKVSREHLFFLFSPNSL